MWEGEMSVLSLFSHNFDKNFPIAPCIWPRNQATFCGKKKSNVEIIWIFPDKKFMSNWSTINWLQKQTALLPQITYFGSIFFLCFISFYLYNLQERLELNDSNISSL